MVGQDTDGAGAAPVATLHLSRCSRMSSLETKEARNWSLNFYSLINKEVYTQTDHSYLWVLSLKIKGGFPLLDQMVPFSGKNFIGIFSFICIVQTWIIINLIR